MVGCIFLQFAAYILSKPLHAGRVIPVRSLEGEATRHDPLDPPVSSGLARFRVTAPKVTTITLSQTQIQFTP